MRCRSGPFYSEELTQQYRVRQYAKWDCSVKECRWSCDLSLTLWLNYFTNFSTLGPASCCSRLGAKTVVSTAMNLQVFHNWNWKKNGRGWASNLPNSTDEKKINLFTNDLFLLWRIVLWTRTFINGFVFSTLSVTNRRQGVMRNKRTTQRKRKGFMNCWYRLKRDKEKDEETSDCVYSRSSSYFFLQNQNIW